VATALQEMRQEINARMRPQLADYASDYLNRLTAGRYSEIEIDEAFNFTLKDDDVSKLVVSGGEEDVINLRLRLALARMITERAGQPFSLLILDEVFGSLDDERRQNLLNLFDTLRSWFEQIFIISHIESINETVDNTLWVRYDSETKKASLSEQAITSFSGDILDQVIEGSNEGSILTQPGLFLDNED
jgi:exonuclease SbcC